MITLNLGSTPNNLNVKQIHALAEKAEGYTVFFFFLQKQTKQSKKILWLGYRRPRPRCAYAAHPQSAAGDTL